MGFLFCFVFLLCANTTETLPKSEILLLLTMVIINIRYNGKFRCFGLGKLSYFAFVLCFCVFVNASLFFVLFCFVSCTVCIIYIIIWCTTCLTCLTRPPTSVLWDCFSCLTLCVFTFAAIVIGIVVCDVQYFW